MYNALVAGDDDADNNFLKNNHIKFLLFQLYIFVWGKLRNIEQQIVVIYVEEKVEQIHIIYTKSWYASEKSFLNILYGIHFK